MPQPTDREIAERLADLDRVRESHNELLRIAGFPDGHWGYETQPSLEYRALTALVAERRQREALSDETPISPAFVDSLGFEYFIPDADGWNAEIAFEHGETRTEVLWWSDGTCIVAQGEDESIRIPGKVTTCGQLRHLLAALKANELEATMKGS